MSPFFPTARLRRLRKTDALRDLVREHEVTPADLVYPIFVEENLDEASPIASMPGLFRVPEKKLADEIKAIQADGIKAVLLFGVSHNKDAQGSDSWKKDGLVARMIKRAKDASPETIVISDTCFCEYTDHGHCGVIEGGHVHNDKTLANLSRQALVAVEAGADMIAPSAMMDGQIQALRKALDGAGYSDTPLMAYASKFASAFYGPFRAAAGCELKGDRKTYQMDMMNAREALHEAALDEAEGADILMVKPGLPYLDILARLRERTDLPLATYQVSGEYAMVKFAAAAGAIDEKRVVSETLGAFKRAGADIVITYFARDFARSF